MTTSEEIIKSFGCELLLSAVEDSKLFAEATPCTSKTKRNQQLQEVRNLAEFINCNGVEDICEIFELDINPKAIRIYIEQWLTVAQSKHF